MTDHEATAKRIVDEWFSKGSWNRSGELVSAVAAALAARDDEREDLLREISWLRGQNQGMQAKLAERDAEIANLKQRLMWQAKDCVNALVEIEQLRARWLYCPVCMLALPLPDDKHIIGRDAAEAKGFVRGLERAKEIVRNEPEYPGVMPDDMWLVIKGDKDAMAETMRVTVRLTKSNIEDAIAAEIAKAEPIKPSNDFVRGLERARQIADGIELMTMDCGIESAIAAEIAKAGKL